LRGSGSMTLQPDALRAVNLVKQFGGVRANDNVSFTIRGGSVTAVIGPNGAGKTTTFNLLTNLYQPDEGNVYFYGDSLAGRSPFWIAARGLVRTFQTPRLFPGISVLANVLSGAHIWSQSTLWEEVLRLPRMRSKEDALRRDA